MDWMGGVPEKAGIIDGSRFLTGATTWMVVLYQKLGKLGKERVWTISAVPGLKTQGSWFQARKMEAPAFLVGANGTKRGKSWDRKRGTWQCRGTEARDQNNSDNSQHNAKHCS